MLNGIQEEDKINELERFVLELWDRIYQAWLASNAENIVGPKVTSDAVYQIWDSFTLNILKTSGEISTSQKLILWQMFMRVIIMRSINFQK